MRRFTSLLTTIGLGGALVAGFAMPQGAKAAAPGVNGRIAYVQNGAIWSMNPDGTDQRQLTVPVGDDTDWSPAWSPGGTMIAYTHSPEPFFTEVWVMNADGSGQHRRINSPRTDAAPSWSPDAVWIAFTSDRDAVQRSVTGEFYLDTYAQSASGSSVYRVTHEEPHRQHAQSPSWSPDRQWTAVSQFGDSGPSGIGRDRAQPQAGRVMNVAAHEAGAGSPDWSPDATRILYHVHDGCCGADIWVVTPGSEPELLIGGPTADMDAAFSPDGSKIVFSRDGVLHLANPDGSGIESLEVEGHEPAWQPTPDEPLVDARFSAFAADITWAREAGITNGCARERFCPDRSLNRGEAADFLVDTLGLPAATTDHFDDDDGTIHEPKINQLAEAEITKGCGTRRFCTTALTTRAMMAAWLDRALDPPDTEVDAFTDDEHSPFEAEINRLAAAGITNGCSATRFCPDALVTRGQAVALLHRATD